MEIEGATKIAGLTKTQLKDLGNTENFDKRPRKIGRILSHRRKSMEKRGRNTEGAGHATRRKKEDGRGGKSALP